MSWSIAITVILVLVVLGTLRAALNRKPDPVALKGPGEYEFDIVGESHYQKNLSKITGGKTVDGVQHRTHARIVMEDDNPYDKKAVRVDIEGRTVGHLAKADARHYRRQMKKLGHEDADAICDAMIIGGWKRSRKDTGSFGVKLDLPTES